MQRTSKLRVAIPDAADALDVVKHEIEGVTGFVVEPEFQEVERSDLVVEVRLVDSNSTDPRRIARRVEHAARQLCVLSNWKASQPAAGTPAPCEAVFGADELMPEVARRALRDDLPTAHWVSTGGGAVQDGAPHWALAVPVTLAAGRQCVAVRRRRGYSYRFDTLDAAATRVGIEV